LTPLYPFSTKYFSIASIAERLLFSVTIRPLIRPTLEVSSSACDFVIPFITKVESLGLSVTAISSEIFVASTLVI
jgi:hypothetical protein